MRLLNGVPAETLPLADRAIQFGDGVFRTIKCRAKRLLFWQRHYQKLVHDCAALGIPAPQEAILRSEIAQLAQETGWQDATFKIIVTRGESARGYAIPAQIQANRIVQIAPLPAYPDTLYQHGARLHLCQIHAGWQPALAGIKHLNRLENVLARQEWSDPSILEGLLCDRDGNVIEGVMSNILLHIDNTLLTPLLDNTGVAGVMRDIALQAAQHLNWKTSTQRITLSQLYEAEQVWICNSLLGLVPVREVAEQHWTIKPENTSLALAMAQLEQEESQCVQYGL